MTGDGLTAAPRSPVTVDLAARTEEARAFLELHQAEQPDAAGDVETRWREIRAELRATGTYVHTTPELAFGARVAWRNTARCIGRLYWQSLHIRDRRHVHDAATIAGEAVEHLRIATNKGRIRPVIPVFAPSTPERPGPRIINDQLIRYAGHRQPDGSVVGDPGYVELTDRAQALGWQPAGRTFEVLPLIIETDGQLSLHTLPSDVVLEVPLQHPAYPWFAELGLRWHAVPAISHMRLRIGGVDYPCAPFNGWYMGTEIGARTLIDVDRYNLLPTVAARLGLDMSHEATLWRDRALVEINIAVLASFRAAGVTIADHHSESHRFLTHLAREEQRGRAVPADWSWIVPPMSGAATPVFHRYYDSSTLSPAFHLDPWPAA